MPLFPGHGEGAIGESGLSTERGPMHMVYVGTNPPHMGGSAVSSWMLLQGLAAKGHHIHVITPMTDTEMAGEGAVKAPPTISVERFRIPYQETNSFEPASITYREHQLAEVTKRLLKLADDQPPDLIWVGRESFAPRVPEIARTMRIPCVVFARGLLKVIANGDYPDPAVGAELLEDCRRADLLVPVAHHLADDLRAMGFGNLGVLTNGVDTEHFTPGADDFDLRRELLLPREARVVLHVSNFNPIKRIEDIVEAAAQTIASDRRLFYVMVGDGVVRTDIESMCRRLGVAEHFRFPGWVSQQSLPDYYRLGKVFVLSSESEVAPRVVLEAMACGRAVLVSDIAAAREIIEDGTDGVVCPCGDTKAIAENIIALLDDSERRHRLSGAARHKIEREYDVRAVVDRFEAMTRRLIASY